MAKSSRKVVEINEIRSAMYDKSQQTILILQPYKLNYFDLQLNQIKLVEFKEEYYKIIQRSGQLFLIAFLKGYYNLQTNQYIKTDRFVKDINIIQNHVFYVEQTSLNLMSRKLESTLVEYHNFDININSNLKEIYHFDQEDPTIYLYVNHKDKNVKNVMKVIKKPKDLIVDVQFEITTPKLIIQDGNHLYFILESGNLIRYNKQNHQTQQLNLRYPIKQYQQLKIIDNVLSILKDDELAVFDLKNQYQVYQESVCRNVLEMFDYNNSIYIRTITNQIWRLNKFITINKTEVNQEDKRYQTMYSHYNKYFVFSNELTCNDIYIKYQSPIKKLLFYDQSMYICLKQEIILASLNCQIIQTFQIDYLHVRLFEQYLIIFDTNGDLQLYHNHQLKLIINKQDLLDFDIYDNQIYIIDNSSHLTIINLISGDKSIYDSNIYSKRVIATKFGCVLINDDIVSQFSLSDKQFDKSHSINRSEFSKLNDVYKYDGFIIIVFNCYVQFETFVLNQYTLQRFDTNYQFLDCEDDHFYMRDELKQLYKCSAAQHLSLIKADDSFQILEKQIFLPFVNKIFEKALKIQNNIVVKKTSLISLDNMAFRVQKSYNDLNNIDKCSFKDNFVITWSNAELSVHHKSLRAINHYRDIIAPDNIKAATMHKGSIILATNQDIIIFYASNTVKKMQFANSPKEIVHINASQNEIDLLYQKNGIQTIQYQFNEAKIRHKINCPIVAQDHSCVVKLGTQRVTFNDETQTGEVYSEQQSMFGPYYKKTQSFNMKDVILQSLEFRGQQFVIGLLGGLWVFE
ncbi:hypothetical protein pb186bvf_010596 [Paramecium bursaria]